MCQFLSHLSVSADEAFVQNCLYLLRGCRGPTNIFIGCNPSGALTCLRTWKVCCSCLRSGAGDPEADFQAQTGAEEAADAPWGGAAAGRRAGRPAPHPSVWGAPAAAGEGEGGAVSEGTGAYQTEVGSSCHLYKKHRPHITILQNKSLLNGATCMEVGSLKLKGGGLTLNSTCCLVFRTP